MKLWRSSRDQMSFHWTVTATKGKADIANNWFSHGVVILVPMLLR
jgi:hypothetical protein